MNKTRRYPILLVFLSQLYEEVLDELVEIFDRLLMTISSRTERKLLQKGNCYTRSEDFCFSLTKETSASDFPKNSKLKLTV